MRHLGGGVSVTRVDNSFARLKFNLLLFISLYFEA